MRAAWGLTVALAVLGCGPRESSEAVSSERSEVTVATAAGELLAFVPTEITVRGHGPLLMTFRNGSRVAHNLVFTDGLDAATRTIVEPGAFDELLLEPLGPGDYPFVCTIHAGMGGRLIVEP